MATSGDAPQSRASRARYCPDGAHDSESGCSSRYSRWRRGPAWWTGCYSPYTGPVEGNANTWALTRLKRERHRAQASPQKIQKTQRRNCVKNQKNATSEGKNAPKAQKGTQNPEELNATSLLKVKPKKPEAASSKAAVSQEHQRKKTKSKAKKGSAQRARSEKSSCAKSGAAKSPAEKSPAEKSPAEKAARGKVPHGKVVQVPLHCNVYLIETPKGLLMVDAGSPLDLRRVHQLLKDHPVSAVFLTHAHADHVGGIWLAARKGLPILSTAGELSALRRMLPPGASRMFSEVRPGERVFDAEVLSLPGHTRNQAGLLLCAGAEEATSKQLIVGDALLERGGAALAPWERLNFDHAQTLRTITRLAEYALPCWPGHGARLSAAAVKRRAEKPIP